MIYLSLSIVATIILVAIAIRRLPYLRPNRLGLEISTPRPYLNHTSPLANFWQKIQSLWQGVFSRKSTLPLEQNVYPLHRSPHPATVSSNSLEFGSSAVPEATGHASVPPFNASATPPEATPLDKSSFWQEEALPPAGVTELPTKGLITRRSESQKIAHELIARADEAFRKKDFMTSEKYYLQAATKDPDNARIYNRLGVIYLQTKNYKDAVEAFRGGLRFDDRVASRHFNLALAYLGKRDYRSSEKYLREALKLDPTNEKYRKTLMALQKQPV